MACGLMVSMSQSVVQISAMRASQVIAQAGGAWPAETKRPAVRPRELKERRPPVPVWSMSEAEVVIHEGCEHSLGMWDDESPTMRCKLISAAKACAFAAVCRAGNYPGGCQYKDELLRSRSTQ